MQTHKKYRIVEFQSMLSLRGIQVICNQLLRDMIEFLTLKDSFRAFLYVTLSRLKEFSTSELFCLQRENFKTKT